MDFQMLFLSCVSTEVKFCRIVWYQVCLKPYIHGCNIILSKEPLHPLMPSSGPVNRPAPVHWFHSVLMSWSADRFLELKLKQLSNPTSEALLDSLPVLKFLIQPTQHNTMPPALTSSLPAPPSPGFPRQSIQDSSLLLPPSLSYFSVKFNLFNQVQHWTNYI